MSLNELLLDIPKPWSNIRVNSIKIDNGVIFSGLSPSLPVQTNSNSQLISSAIDASSSTQIINTLPINRGGTNSHTALTNGKLISSSGGALVEGTSSSTPTFDSITLNGLAPLSWLFSDSSKVISSSLTIPILSNGNGYYESSVDVQTASDGANTPVQFADVNINTMGTLMTILNTHSRYTFVTGIEVVDIAVSFNISGLPTAFTGTLDVYILRNGTDEFALQNIPYTASNAIAASCSSTIRVSNGQYIECFVAVTGASVSINGTLIMKQLV
jgi:hypothetical protein